LIALISTSVQPSVHALEISKSTFPYFNIKSCIARPVTPVMTKMRILPVHAEIEPQPVRLPSALIDSMIILA
jgi:hypothetical protein